MFRISFCDRGVQNLVAFEINELRACLSFFGTSIFGVMWHLGYILLTLSIYFCWISLCRRLYIFVQVGRPIGHCEGYRFKFVMRNLGCIVLSTVTQEFCTKCHTFCLSFKNVYMCIIFWSFLVKIVANFLRLVSHSSEGKSPKEKTTCMVYFVIHLNKVILVWYKWKNNFSDRYGFLVIIRAV